MSALSPTGVEPQLDRGQGAVDAPPPLHRAQSRYCERGQASLLMLGIVGAALAGVVVLFAFGNALGAKGRYQRAADLAAISAAQVMRELYPRLFESPFIEPDVPNSRHLGEAEYRSTRRGRCC